MTTIINKIPSEILNTYFANRYNNPPKLFLVKNGVDIPFQGVFISGNIIRVIKLDSTIVTVEEADTLELRT